MTNYARMPQTLQEKTDNKAAIVVFAPQRSSGFRFAVDLSSRFTVKGLCQTLHAFGVGDSGVVTKIVLGA